MKQWIGVLLAVVVFVGVWTIQQHRQAALDESLKQKQRAVQRLAVENPTLPAEGELDWLNRQIQERVVTYDALVGLIDPEQESLPADRSEQGLHVVEQLHRVTSALRRDAKAAGVALPAYLGITDDIPSPDQIHARLRQVQLLERVVGVFVQAGVPSVDLVKPMEAKPFVSAGVRHTELPLQVSVTCSSDMLIRALHGLQAVGPLVFVRELKVTRSAEHLLDVNLVASAMLVEQLQMDEEHG